MRKKHYLTGVDWFVVLFDYLAKQHTGIGNLFQIVVELDGILPADALIDCLQRLYAHFPYLTGRIVRSFNLAPYYQPLPSKCCDPAERLTIYHAKDQADVLKQIIKLANLPFAQEAEHLEWHLIYTKTTTRLVMRCDHRLFDARGAEAFLYQLELAWQGIPFRQISLQKSSHLNQWSNKFRAGQKINRMFLKQGNSGAPCVLPISRAEGSGYTFAFITFSKSETGQILNKAYKEAGYLLLMPYLLAVTIEVFHPIFTSRGINNGGYVIPVTIDRREKRTVNEELFFNHLSFLFFHIFPVDIAGNFNSLLNSVKLQLYEQIKNKFPEALYEAGFLMRILPPSLLTRIMLSYLKGQLASFSFSYLGDTAYPAESLMGLQIKNIVHTPRLPVPPGVGTFFTQFQGRLNLTLSFLDGLLSSTEVNLLKNKFYQRLLRS